MKTDWIKNEDHTFKYNGETVVRKGMQYFGTPLGLFKVYDTIWDYVFYEYPQIQTLHDMKKIITSIKMKCETLDEGKQKCEEIWNEFKEKVNKI